MSFSIECEDLSIAPVIEGGINGFIAHIESIFKKTSPVFVIKVHTSRESFDKSLGRKTEEWEVGNTKGNVIEIISFKSLDAESYHKKEEFFPILKHEICHIFYFSSFGTSSPMWFNEGLCSFYCTPKTGRVLSKKIDVLKNLSLDKMYSPAGFREVDSLIRYELAWALVNEIVFTFGEEKLKEFLNSLNNPCQKEDFEFAFKKAFNEGTDNLWASLISKIENKSVNPSK